MRPSVRPSTWVVSSHPEGCVIITLMDEETTDEVTRLENGTFGPEPWSSLTLVILTTAHLEGPRTTVFLSWPQGCTPRRSKGKLPPPTLCKLGKLPPGPGGGTGAPSRGLLPGGLRKPPCLFRAVPSFPPTFLDCGIFSSGRCTACVLFGGRRKTSHLDERFYPPTSLRPKSAKINSFN